MNERPGRKFVARKFAKEKIQLNRSHFAEEPRKRERRHPTGPEHINWIGIITEHKTTTITWSPTKILFPESEFPTLQIHANVGIEQVKLIYHWHGRSRLEGILIDGCNGLARGQWELWSRGCVLDLSAAI